MTVVNVVDASGAVKSNTRLEHRGIKLSFSLCRGKAKGICLRSQVKTISRPLSHVTYTDEYANG